MTAHSHAPAPLAIEDRPARPALCMKEHLSGWLCTRPVGHEGACE